MASRYAMEILCRYIDVKAQGCGGLNEHGKTVVKADGKYYIYTTGFNEPRPRSYMVSETTYSYLAEHAKEMEIWMGYFDRGLKRGFSGTTGDPFLFVVLNKWAKNSKRFPKIFSKSFL